MNPKVVGMDIRSLRDALRDTVEIMKKHPDVDIAKSVSDIVKLYV